MDEEEIIAQFIKVIESSFDDVRSEFKLDAALTELEFMSPLTKCELFEVVDKTTKGKPRRKQRKQTEVNDAVLDVDGRNLQKRCHENVYSDESEESDQSESDDMEANEEEHQTSDGNPIIKGEVVLMPIEFQIKKFFELPNVFEKVKLNTIKIQEGKDLDHFIKGKCWKKKMEKFEPGQLVIPFHFYGDGAQINHPLGPHTKSGEQQLNYFSFPTIPYEYQSRLDNIFVAQLYPAKYHQQFSTEKLYNNIIEVFKSLAEDGVILNINGTEIKVFFVCGIYIGDNKEQNQTLGFVKGFVGKHCCRYCRMELKDIRTSINSLGAIRRNRENYDQDVATDNVTDTGIEEDSPFNMIPCFHVTESSGADLAHDLTEGSVNTSLSKAILYFIDQRYFNLDYLNDQIRLIDFGEAENGNRPATITIKKKKSFKLKMTSSEMSFFAHHLPFMIGDRVPESDPVWKHVLETIKMIDLCYLHSYNDESINALRATCENFNKGLMDLFNLRLQHKCHLLTHYADLTEEFGPLRYVQTIRYEGKNRENKNYAKNTNSRVNLSYSLGKKNQYKFADRLLRGDGLEDRISETIHTTGTVNDKVYFSRLVQSTQLNEIISKECLFTKKVTVNGIIFSPDLWLPNFVDDGRRIYEIIDILALGLNDISKIFAVCKLYTKVTYERHYECYSVHMNSLQEELVVVNINSFLQEHQHSVKIHTVGDKKLFRCKRF